MTTHEYAFDIVMMTAIRVRAESEEEARKMLHEALDCADSNFGAWPDGKPILGEASISERPRLYEVDGKEYEPAQGSDEHYIRRAEEDGADIYESDGKWHARSRDEELVASNATTIGLAARMYCKEMDLDWDEEAA